MRFRFKPNSEQRSNLKGQLARLQQPEAALEALDSVLPADFKPASVLCTPRSVHSDRFVIQAQVRSDAGEERAYALKVYSDDFGQQIWAHAQPLAVHSQPTGSGLCLPTGYLPHLRMLIFPWVNGPFLSE